MQPIVFCSLEQQRRLARAEAARNQAISLTEAERKLAISSIQAEATLDIRTAQANGLAVTYNSTAKGDIDLPVGVSPSTPDLGQINVVSTSYAVAQPGAIGDGWYLSYLGNFFDGYWYYSWNGYGSYYGASTGQYDFTWGYDGFAGAYGGFGAYYGYWGYGPGAFGWGGWSPSYVSAPVAATNSHAIDVESAVAGHTAKVNSLTAPVETTTNGLAASEQEGISQINLVDGDVNPDPTGANTANPVAQDLAASVKVIADESTGFTWEGTFEEYLKEYGDEGLSLYAFVTRQGWEVQKGSYGWISTRQDWWLDTQEKILYIGDTDWGGITYRSNENAAAQLHQGLMGVIAHENFLEEIDLMIREDFAELPWYAKAYRFSTAVAANSLLSGIKSVENAIVGETISGQKLGGWDRLKLGAVGSIETLLTVVPAGKAVAAVGGKVVGSKVGAKIGLASVAESAVGRTMAADITRGFGTSAANYLASSRVGQGFIRAYAKVYDSKYNKAIYGTKTPLSVEAGAGASSGAPLETRLRANMKRTNPGNFSNSMKRDIGEARTSLTLRRAGYEELPAKLPSDHGFDGVWVKKNAEGEITDLIITESKFSKTGRASLPQTKTKGQQLSGKWIEATIKEMLKQRSNAAVRETALQIRKFQAQGGVVVPKAAVLDPSGKLRYNKITIPEQGLETLPPGS